MEEEDLVFQPVQLEEVLREVMDLSGHRLRRHQVELTTGFEPGLPQIQGNHLGLTQVFLNLVLNAIDAMPDGGRLHISSARVESHLVAVVRDTGHGIPEDRIDRIFDPFYTTREVGQGVGLGLSVVHGILEKHGGRIHAESVVGEGASFTVYLPLSATVTDRWGKHENTAGRR